MQSVAGTSAGVRGEVGKQANGRSTTRSSNANGCDANPVAKTSGPVPAARSAPQQLCRTDTPTAHLGFHAITDTRRAFGACW
uniref:Uncharacterized protein n=1 Tax=Knipowitschia caucasica TaxID=637954 RepID=A0AAV2JW71_KNICA